MAVMLPSARTWHTQCDPYPRAYTLRPPTISQLNGSSPAGNGGSGGVPKGNNDPGGDSLARGPKSPPTPPPDGSKPSETLADSKAVSLPDPFNNGGTPSTDGGGEDAEAAPEPAPIPGGTSISSSRFGKETMKPQFPSQLQRPDHLHRRGESNPDPVAMSGSGDIRSAFNTLDASSLKASVSSKRICIAKPEGRSGVIAA